MHWEDKNSTCRSCKPPIQLGQTQYIVHIDNINRKTILLVQTYNMHACVQYQAEVRYDGSNLFNFNYLILTLYKTFTKFLTFLTSLLNMTDQTD